MQKLNTSRFICIGAILVALTVIFQSAPVFLPSIGLVLSPFSTLPIAIAAVINISLGFLVFFASVLILVIVSVEETIILLFTTGVLGIVIGTLLYRKGIKISILVSSVALSLGMICLTYLIGISAFVDLTRLISTLIIFLAYFSFSFIYACIWNICFKKFMNYLSKIKLIT